jgi:hypothetical protein
VLPVPQPPCDCSQAIIWSESGCFSDGALTSWFHTAPAGNRGSGSAAALMENIDKTNASLINRTIMPTYDKMGAG